MNKLTIIPCVIAFLQLISLGHLYYIHKYRSTQFPADLIELNIFAILNIGVLILAYFLYFNSEKKTGLWLIPIVISVLIIVSLLLGYLWMWINKYK